MSKDKWVWMPHAGHFICGHWCRFKLNTYVNGYIVSTVGEMQYGESAPIEEVGCNRMYETMVFRAKKSKNKCCPWKMVNEELDFEGYNKPEDAYAGHLKMCRKYDRLAARQKEERT